MNAPGIVCNGAALYDFAAGGYLDTVMLDARSLLGLMSLIGQRVHVVAEDYVNPRSFGKLVQKMA